MKNISRLFAVLLIMSSVFLGMAGCKEQEETADVTPPAEDTTIALTITKGVETAAFTLTEVKALPDEEGWGGIMNSSGVISGPFRQKGVILMSLLDEVGGISASDAIRITAKDGYSMTYSYDQIANGNFTTLDCSTGEEVPHGELTVIVSYEEDGMALTDQNGPLRIAILNDNTQVTEGHWWVKWVENIEVVALEQSWSLYLEGAITEDIDNATFESGAAPGCHGASWTDDDGHIWEGIPLWLLVGRVDDDNPHSKETQAFNDAVADTGYEVQVIATDGYSKTFTSAEVKRNDNMIIAFRCDDEPLEEDKWPLRLVGPDLTGGQMVSQISTIKVILPETSAPEPEWTLHLEGALSEDITDSYFAAAFDDCHSASWADDDGHLWEGIPLWLFVGRVDDDFKHNPNEPGAFDDDLADAGAYEVQVIAADGYSKTFTSAEVKRNDNMIIAFRCDDEPLEEDKWPLRLVGPDLTGGQMVSQISTIELIFP